MNKLFNRNFKRTKHPSPPVTAPRSHHLHPIPWPFFPPHFLPCHSKFISCYCLDGPKCTFGMDSYSVCQGKPAHMENPLLVGHTFTKYKYASVSNVTSTTQITNNSIGTLRKVEFFLISTTNRTVFGRPFPLTRCRY